MGAFSREPGGQKKEGQREREMSWREVCSDLSAREKQRPQVSEMFKHFSLLRSGISILLIFFGGVLLLRNEVRWPAAGRPLPSAFLSNFDSRFYCGPFSQWDDQARGMRSITAGVFSQWPHRSGHDLWQRGDHLHVEHCGSVDVPLPLHGAST